MTAWIQLAPDVVVGEDYRVLQPLGSGGMGAVYLAEQLSTGKQRALKVMHPQMVEDAQQRRRFVQEARVGALIDSDHVVDVVAAGIDEPSGVPWIAMELLDGEDLAHALKTNGPLSPCELLTIFRQLCHALDAAHSAGVIHRDIKPQNVFLARSRRPGTPKAVKVLDFGIAKVVAGTQTAATSFLGSPAWMAPEQTDPAVPITTATDLWPLGLLAFWLLTGQSFWRTAANPDASMHAIMREILFDPIARPSKRAAELGCQDRLPPGFDDWFERCVHREPRARFRSAGDLLRGLERLVGEPERAEGTDAAAPESGPAGAAPGNDGQEDVADVATSTRSFVAAAHLDVQTGPSSKDERERLSASEQDEPVAPARLEQEGEVEPALGPAGTGTTLGSPDQPEPPAGEQVPDRTVRSARSTRGALDRSGPPRDAPVQTLPNRRRLTRGLAAAAAVTMAAAGLWLSFGRGAGQETEAATGDEPVVSASSATAAAAQAKGSQASSAQPTAAPAPEPFATVTSERFDPSAFLAAAHSEARRHVADAELEKLLAVGVDDAGRIDLTEGDRTASYRFRSAKGSGCVHIRVDQTGAYSEKLAVEDCPGRVVAPPRCTVAELLRTVERGHQLKSLPIARVSYAAGIKEVGVWTLAAGELTLDAVPDSCGQTKHEVILKRPGKEKQPPIPSTSPRDDDDQQSSKKEPPPEQPVPKKKKSLKD